MISGSRKLSRLEYGSLLAYTPKPIRGNQESENSVQIMKAVKNLWMLKDGRSWIDYYVDEMKSQMAQLPFNKFFVSAALVPIPRSSMMKPNSLWVSREICKALEKHGMGVKYELLRRTRPLPQSSRIPAKERPPPTEHYNSLSCDTLLSPRFSRVVLVDDIITRGHTALGAAWRVAEAYPELEISLFALIRTVSNPAKFSRIWDPCVGTITYRQKRDDALRRP
ncbi:hypothetical protein HRbin01_00775 [archaeon HR01]|nr:hypothetical protein HRbin01_00775 [archaeon HR01]